MQLRSKQEENRTNQERIESLKERLRREGK